MSALLDEPAVHRYFAHRLVLAHRWTPFRKIACRKAASHDRQDLAETRRPQNLILDEYQWLLSRILMTGLSSLKLSASHNFCWTLCSGILTHCLFEEDVHQRWQFIGICESHRFFCPRFFLNLTNFFKPRKTNIYIILKWSRRVFRIESITLSNWLPCYLYCSLFIQNKIKISAILPLAYSLIHERLMLYNSSLTKSLCSNYSFSW